MLGIFIGVASVIWLLAIGEGISHEAQRQIEGLGADNIIIRSIKPPAEVMGSFGRADSLRPEARRIRHARADDPHDQGGPAHSRGPPHVHLRRPQRRRPPGRLHAGVFRGDAANWKADERHPAGGC